MNGPTDGLWIAERGSRMPSGKYWWLTRNQITGQVWAHNKKWHAEDQAARLNMDRL